MNETDEENFDHRSILDDFDSGEQAIYLIDKEFWNDFGDLLDEDSYFSFN